MFCNRGTWLSCVIHPKEPFACRTTLACQFMETWCIDAAIVGIVRVWKFDFGSFPFHQFGFKVSRFKVGSFQVLVQFLVLFIRWSDTLKRPNSLKEIAQQQQQCSIMIFNCHTAHAPWSMALAAEWRWRSSTLFMSFAELWKDAIFVGKETLLQLLLTN